MPYFRNDITRLFQELGPLYQEIHAYTRRRLMSLYGSSLFPLSGHIPAHLLGLSRNLFGKKWYRLWYDIYENVSSAGKVYDGRWVGVVLFKVLHVTED